MNFFGPKLLLLLKRHSLEIYYKDSSQVMNVSFQTSAVRHLEVVSKDEVTKTLVDAFKSANLSRQNAIILLSDHIIFERLIPGDDPEIVKKALAKFYNDVPLDEAHIAKKIMPLKGSVLALAANRELYSLIIEVAREFEWKIKAVIPMTPFAKLAENVQLTSDQVSQVLDSGQVFKETDFLSENSLPLQKTEKSEEERAEGDKSKAKIVLTISLVLFLLSFIIGSLFFFNVLKVPNNLPWIKASPAPVLIREISKLPGEAQFESSSSSQLQLASVSGEIKRQEVKIHVLNGSGLSGQASRLKKKLAEIGFENVLTGNIENLEASQSSIVYSKKLPQIIKAELGELMDSLIEGVSRSEDNLSEFDAVINLGKLKQPIE